MALLKCSNAAFAYDGHTAVEGLTFSVSSGDYLCIVGENGSGKSTLMKGLLGLKAPSAGSIETGDGLIAAEIGYLPQQTQVQKDFPASVEEVVLSGRAGRPRAAPAGKRNALSAWRPYYGRSDKAIARDNMERLGILPLRHRCYRELSGGQQQRVLLARALCATKSLLLLDEPTAGLDPMATRDLYRLIAEVNAQGLTVIMVSHDIGAAVQYATHILHLQQRQLFFGTTAEYLTSPEGMRFIDRTEFAAEGVEFNV
ncbi:MAG: metal ABC transporter ATP-binding protein [Oscillospiraceae bacterium]|jgi:zinc transport system ATP-binding protein|nr:metal ABC transporter ATP-binding protein [Oscillospiraceae bacterium]